MRPATVSSALAPLALVIGFSLAAARQPQSYDWVRDTISALAARGATDRWIMSAAFVALGSCHVVTASGLDRALAARALLAVGGVASAALALAPQPASGSSTAHVALAGIALIALAGWPLAGTARERLVGLGLVALLVGFAVTLRTGAAVGVAERLLTVAEALAPILAVHTARRAGRTRAGPP